MRSKLTVYNLSDELLKYPRLFEQLDLLCAIAVVNMFQLIHSSILISCKICKNKENHFPQEEKKMSIEILYTHNCGNRLFQ